MNVLYVIEILVKKFRSLNILDMESIMATISWSQVHIMVTPAVLDIFVVSREKG